MCEPIYDQVINIDHLFPKKPDKSGDVDDISVEENVFGVKYESDHFRVLPLLSFTNEHVNRILSLKENEYLRCRYAQFTSKIPDHYVKICLYKDFYKKVQVVRRMQLNGQIYGLDNKLAPVPYLPDPRHIIGKTPCRHR